MNKIASRVDQLVETIRSGEILTGHCGETRTLYMFDYSAEEAPYLNWFLSLLPMQLSNRSVHEVNLFDCAQAYIQRRGYWDKLREFTNKKGVSKSLKVAGTLLSDSVVDSVLSEVANVSGEVVLLSGIGDLSAATSPSGILSQLSCRLPEAPALIALLPGVVDRDNFRLFDSEERIFPVFRYLRLVP